jgi:hypothetical protein
LIRLRNCRLRTFAFPNRAVTFLQHQASNCKSESASEKESAADTGAITAGLPILARFLRKSGIPRSPPAWDLDPALQRTPSVPPLARAHSGVTQNRFSLWRFPCEPLCPLWLFAGHTWWPILARFLRKSLPSAESKGWGFHGRRPLRILILFARHDFLGRPARRTHLYPCTTGRSHCRRWAVRRLRWPSHLFVMKIGRLAEAANFSDGTFPVAFT